MGPERGQFHESRRKFLKTGVALVAGVMLSEMVDEYQPKSELVGPRELSEGRESVLLFSDIHVGVKSSEKQANREAYLSLQRTIESLLPYHFDVVAQLGDMIKETRERGQDMENVEAVVRTINEVSADKYIHLLGNHDLWGLNIKELEEAMQKAGQISEFYGIHDLTHQQLVWFDVSMEKNRATLGKERVEWFRDTVDPKKPIVILSHYGILPTELQNNYYFNHKPQAGTYSDQDLWTQMKDLPIKAMISGHVHWYGYKKHEDTHLISLPSFSENIASRDNDYNPGVYSVLELGENELRLQAFSGGYPFISVELE